MFTVMRDEELVRTLERDETRNSMGLYEVILNRGRVKPYFDIDIYANTKDELRGALQPFTEALLGQIPRADLAISGGVREVTAKRAKKHGAFKASWHVTVCNLYFDSQNELLHSGLLEWLGKTPELGAELKQKSQTPREPPSNNTHTH